mgnify:CR=1 FL=1
MKISIGIDIGSNGAYAIFVDGKLQYGKIPRVSEELNMRSLFDIIFDSIPNRNSDEDLIDIHCVIEDLHSVFGSSAKSNFGFGFNNGAVVAMLQVAEIPFTKIGPKKWQKQMWEGIRPVEIPVPGKKNKDGSPKHKIDAKATSLIAAKRLFPKETFLATERSKVPHNGIVDAVLLAEYCKRHF